MAVVCDARAKRGKETGNTLCVGAKTVTVFLTEKEFFAGDEAQQQERFAEEHHRKSKAALKRAQGKDEEKIGDVLRVADIAERSGGRERCTIGAGAGTPVSAGPGQEERASCCQGRCHGIQETDEHVPLNDTLVPGNNKV